MIRKLLLLAALGLFVAGAAGCGDDSTDTGAADEPGDEVATTTEALGGDGPGAAAGACPEGDPDCYEDGSEGAPALPGSDEALREEAKALLGLSREQLPDDVRIGRIGDESFALTEDYRVGRMTVELDEDDDGVMTVVMVTAELDAGPEVFEAGMG